MINRRAITNWTGTNTELSSNGARKGVLAIQIGEGVTVKT